MSIENYIVYRDKFKPADTGNSLDFPCFAGGGPPKKKKEKKAAGEE